jgi:hypothetical protein
MQFIYILILQDHKIIKHFVALGYLKNLLNESWFYHWKVVELQV